MSSPAQESADRYYEKMKGRCLHCKQLLDAEKTCGELAQDRLNWKQLANRNFPQELKELNLKLRKENAELLEANKLPKTVFCVQNGNDIILAVFEKQEEAEVFVRDVGLVKWNEAWKVVPTALGHIEDWILKGING